MTKKPIRIWETREKEATENLDDSVNVNMTVIGTHNWKKGQNSDISSDEHHIQYVPVQGSAWKDML